MATFPRITSRSSSLAGTMSGNDNDHSAQRPRTPYPETSSDGNTLTQSITNSSASSGRHEENIRSAVSTRSSSRSLPPSPLDNIPSKLYARFPRFCMTTEHSQPDLSIEDVTSTRFSIDEEGIVAIPYSSRSDHDKTKRPGKLRCTIRKAISHQTLLLKKAKIRVRRMPSHLGLVSKFMEKSSQPSSTTESEITEKAVSENAPILPAIPRQSAELQLKSQAQDNDPFVYRSTIRENTYRSVSKLSALEEHRASFDSSQETPRPMKAITIKPKREPITHFPPHTLRYKFPPPSFTPHASTTTVNSYHTALERPPLRRPSPLTRRSHEIPRSMSSVYAADSRFYPFSFPPERTASSSNLSSRQSSIASISQTSTQRPGSSYSRPVSVRSEDWRAAPLQQEPLFVEMSAQSKVDVNFVFPSRPEISVGNVSLSSQSHSRATSVHSFGSKIDRPVIIRSASVIQSSHLDQSHRKVPLFVPKRIEKHSLSDENERPPLPGKRGSDASGTGDVASGSERLRAKTSEWSMTYQEGAVGRVSIDLASDSATIRPVKRGPLNEIMNHFSSNRNKGSRLFVEEMDNSSRHHTSFAKGCGSCVRRLSRAFKGKHPDDLTSSSCENLHTHTQHESSKSVVY